MFDPEFCVRGLPPHQNFTITIDDDDDEREGGVGTGACRFDWGEYLVCFMIFYFDDCN